VLYGAASLRSHFELCAATRLGFFFSKPYAKPTSPHVIFNRVSVRKKTGRGK
jgi:hypothetical protein